MHFLKLYDHRTFLIIKQSAKELGAQIIYIDENLKFNKNIFKKKKLNKISEKKYARFEENYIGFPGLKSYGRWKTILRYLDSVQYV